MQDRAREILLAMMRYSLGRYQLVKYRGGPRLWFAFGLLWLLVQQGCVPSPYVYVGPDKTGDGLLTAAASDVKMNTKPLVQMIDQIRQGQVDYGYLWWRKRGRNAKTRQTIDLIHTSGNGGQYIFVVPHWQLVVVFTGGNYNSPLASQPFAMLAQIFRSILSFRASHSMQGVPSPAPTTRRSAP